MIQKTNNKKIACVVANFKCTNIMYNEIIYNFQIIQLFYDQLNIKLINFEI